MAEFPTPSIIPCRTCPPQDQQGGHAAGRHDISVIRPSDREHLAEEAAQWLARLELGTADRDAFERWRSRSPAHAIAFARVQASWEQFGNASGAENGIASPSPVSRRALMRAAMAASIVGVFAGGGILTSRAYAWDRAETGVGETKSVRLPDGSTAMLNTDSAIAWKMDGERRVVRLGRGEVALDILPGTDTLSLESAGLRARLSAGRFNARLKAGALDVMVLKGEAHGETQALHSAQPDNRAGAYHTLLLTSGTPSVRAASQQQMAETLAWQNGEILFQDEPLSAALDEYNRYLRNKIVIIDSDLAGIRVGGRFTSTDPSAFLDALRTSLDIEVQPADGNYLLTRKK